MVKEVEDFYKQHFDTKVKISSRVLKGDWHGAEDCVQEAFYKALKYYPSFDPTIATFDKWFNGILFSCIRDYQRAMHNHPEPMLAELSPEDVLIELGLYDDPDNRKIIVERVERVKNSKHKRVLHLFFILGYNSKEIGEIEPDISQSNVTTILHRFREGL